MTTITIILPDELVEQAKAKGLLSSAAIESYVRDKLREVDAGGQVDELPNNIPLDPRLEGLVNPAAFRKGKITGDVIGPFHEEWEESK